MFRVVVVEIAVVQAFRPAVPGGPAPALSDTAVSGGVAPALTAVPDGVEG
jgi:hypothetical protein